MNKLYERLKKAIFPPEISYTLSPEEIELLVDYIEKMQKVKEYLDGIKNVVESNYSLQKMYEILGEDL